MSDFSRFLNDSRVYFTDGGLETSMLFDQGIELPHFASIHLFDSEEGREALNAYFDRFLLIAAQAGTGFVLDTATWRSSFYWGPTLGRSEGEMAAGNRTALAFAQSVRNRWADRIRPIVINGVVGPAGDGYAPEAMYTAEDAEAVHGPQIEILAREGADMISAITMTHPGEAIGIARAALAHDTPVVIAFTVETDGHLPNGQSLPEAIAETDAATGDAPLFYMINCAHPDHFRDALGTGAPWLERIGGIRANASRMSHAELDAAEELDAGDPQEFGHLNAALARVLPNVRVFGGCCGTDHRHVGEVSHCLRHHRAA